MTSVTLVATRNKVYRLVCLPAGIAVVFPLLLTIFYGVHAGYSALLGTVIWLLPNFYVAYKLFSKIEVNPQHFVLRFFRTEMMKLVITAVLFVGISKIVSVAMLPFLMGYMATQVVFWFSFFLL